MQFFFNLNDIISCATYNGNIYIFLDFLNTPKNSQNWSQAVPDVFSESAVLAMPIINNLTSSLHYLSPLCRLTS